MGILSAFLGELQSVGHILRHNKGRSLLTLLGMIIGAGSVVLLAGLLAGGEEALVMSNQFINDADVIRVDSTPVPPDKRARTNRTIDRADQEALAADRLLGLDIAEGENFAWDKRAFYGADKMQVMLIGVTERAQEMYRVSLQQGRFLDPDDLRRSARVCVVGNAVWRELLKEPKSLDGVTLRIGDDPFAVVGVLQHKPAIGGMRRGATWDGRVAIPTTTFQSVVRHSRKVDRLFLRLPQTQDILARLDPARAMTRTLLLRRHYGVENFRIDRDKEFKQQRDMIFLVINVLMLCTAGLSLLCGGINIMNIMLVTVTERTREIGVRRALGATRGDILRQFLMESAILAGLGGAMGVLCGLGLTYLASRILTSVVGSWTAHYKLWAMALGLGSATLAGVVFGLYPAWRAGRLDPVEALRYE